MPTKTYLPAILLILLLQPAIVVCKDREQKQDSTIRDDIHLVQDMPRKYKTIDAVLAGRNLRVEIANTPYKRSRGLMFRTKLEWNEGMLFIFPEERMLSFWMKNTLLPLDIAFFDASGRLVSHFTMMPQPGVPDEKLKVYPSRKPALYALELKKGWFKKFKLRKGSRIKLEKSIPGF